MAEGEKTRLIAWSRELHAVHERLREALRVTRDTLHSGGTPDPPVRELLVFCHGFCTALTGHHEGEDRTLFPAIAAAHPELRDTLRRLEQDHSMIAYLVEGLRAALDRGASDDELERHLDGVGAIMENHFRYEERQLLAVLDTLDLDVELRDALGPL
ncbi:hemerythrin domain-containing protein [Saccharomonospora sp. NB11]|jgi:hemerythrin-like domain-containing protein|uniref:hemerythrin domain-containing protein n=1 Tax=Saccharomonospora sp. NB11 TaxID=1642298 RepID=UPI0018D0CDEE|nr:hemerythrin domain-containing protein [Saccharomonospora sp. NB11]